DGVVEAAGVLDDGAQRIPAVGIEHGALVDEDVALQLDGVHRAVAVARIGRVVTQEVDRLLAVQVDDAQHLAALDDAPPRTARWHDLVAHHIRPWAVCHRKLPSLLPGPAGPGRTIARLSSA